MTVRRTSAPPPPKPSRGAQIKKDIQKVEAAVENVVKEVVKEVESFLPRLKPAAVPKDDGFNAPSRTTFTAPTVGQWTKDTKGQRADPVTLYVHGSLPNIESALKADGWTAADPNNLGSDAKYVGSSIAQEGLDGLGKLNGGIDKLINDPLLPTAQPKIGEVQEMPVSPQTYIGKPLVAAFERNNNPLGGRDHLRIFDTGLKDASGQPVYAIAASHDAGIVVAPNHPETGFLFHKVQPDVSSERDAVLQSLEKKGATVLQQLSLGWAGTSVYGEKVADGKAYDVALP